LKQRRQFLPWQQVLAHQADPELAQDLRELLPETTDDLLFAIDHATGSAHPATQPVPSEDLSHDPPRHR
jgi:hypothetical protein